MTSISKKRFLAVFAVLACTLVPTLAQRGPKQADSLKFGFTSVPPSGPGGPVDKGVIEGKIDGPVPKGAKLVIYSEGDDGNLYVQPAANRPYTSVAADGGFGPVNIFLGRIYWCVLVTADSKFVPRPQLANPPEPGGGVIAIGQVKGGSGGEKKN